MYNGIINVYKEKGFTSHDVVAKLRGILKQKKIGHTGTLDPDATGVLPVCLGNGTKLCDMLTDRSKEYETVLLLGVSTDTEDISGKVLSEREVCVSEESIRGIIMSFVGEYDQIPPMYSAIKINGKKLYELAREGREIERKPRRVVIEALEITGLKLPRVKFRVVCTKGTYIRSLCRDIGEAAGCGGCMESLVRTRVGGFFLEEAYTLSSISALADNGEAYKIITPVDACFEEYPGFAVSGRTAALVRNGNMFSEDEGGLFLPKDAGENKTGSRFRVYISEDGGENFAGIYEYDRSMRAYRPVKMFLSGE